MQFVTVGIEPSTPWLMSVPCSTEARSINSDIQTLPSAPSPSVVDIKADSGFSDGLVERCGGGQALVILMITLALRCQRL